MAWRGGYLDASVEPSDLNTRRMYESFGYQHITFASLVPQDVLVWERYFSDVPFDRLGSGVGLDAGCGNGRFAAFLAPRLRALVALDGSVAVGAAARNLRSFSNVAVIRGDLRSAPLQPHAFDFICCIGVLHHFTDPEEGLGALAKLLVPGGLLLTFVYSRPSRGTVRSFVIGGTAALRRATVGLPHALTRVISSVIAPILYGALVVPGRAGERLGLPRLARLPLRMYRNMPLRTLRESVFDVLSAPLERRYTWPEIEPWFARAGLLIESAREDDGLVVLARAPSGGAPA
jgi:SAM-dependent methyltransferase